MPAKSKAQNRLMQAAARGDTRLGVARKVAREFVRKTKGVKHLPERVKHG